MSDVFFVLKVRIKTLRRLSKVRREMCLNDYDQVLNLLAEGFETGQGWAVLDPEKPENEEKTEESFITA